MQGSNPAAPTGQSVSNAYGIGSRYDWPPQLILTYGYVAVAGTVAVESMGLPVRARAFQRCLSGASDDMLEQQVETYVARNPSTSPSQWLWLL
jgi:hypothetical protein